MQQEPSVFVLFCRIGPIEEAFFITAAIRSRSNYATCNLFFVDVGQRSLNVAFNTYTLMVLVSSLHVKSKFE